MRHKSNLRAVLMMLLEYFKGPRTVTETKSAENALGSLQGYSVRGYKITIFCQRKEYLVQYHKRFIPNTRRTTYRVFSAVTNDAPEALKKACELDVDLPNFISAGNFDNEIRRAVVHAYLDLLDKQLTSASTA
jgi:hypothetical protein